MGKGAVFSNRQPLGRGCRAPRDGFTACLKTQLRSHPRGLTFARKRLVVAEFADDGVDGVFGVTQYHSCVVFEEQRVVDAGKACVR